MNFNDLITKYPDETLRQAISDAYQVGYDEGVQAAAGKVVNALGELQDAVNLKAGTATGGYMFVGFEPEEYAMAINAIEQDRAKGEYYREMSIQTKKTRENIGYGK